MIFIGRKRNRAILGVLQIFILLWAKCILAQESAGEAGTFLQIGVGGRVLSMGKAFVGLADGPAATYWNPAGLARIGRSQVEFMYSRMPFDRNYNFISGVFPVNGIFTVGVSWIGLRIGDIEARTANTTAPDYTFSNFNDAFAVSFGKTVTSFLSVGGTLKYVRTGLDDFSADGFGIDGAVLLQPFDRLSLGLLLQNLSTSIMWQKSYDETIPMNLRIGAAFRVAHPVLITADVGKDSQMKPTLHLGGEVRLTDSLPVRMGFNDGQMTGGIGLDLEMAQHGVEINYGFSNSNLVDEFNHTVSLIVSFGKYAYPKLPPSNSPGQIRIDQVEKASVETPSVIVTADVLNVRSGPGTEYHKIAQIRGGEKFELIGRNSTWEKIRLEDGRDGWVHQDYVQEVSQ